MGDAWASPSYFAQFCGDVLGQMRKQKGAPDEKALRAQRPPKRNGARTNQLTQPLRAALLQTYSVELVLQAFSDRRESLREVLNDFRRVKKQVTPIRRDNLGSTLGQRYKRFVSGPEAVWKTEPCNGIKGYGPRLTTFP